MKTTNFETKSIRGRTLDKAKLERWIKPEGMSVKVAKGEENGPPTTLGKLDIELR
jgi:hypothetical protein